MKRAILYICLGWSPLQCAVLLLCLISLTGCAGLPAPYPEFMLKKADPWKGEVKELNREALQEACRLDYGVGGCTRLVTGEIFILAHSDEAYRACVLAHERSHLYDVYIKQMPMEETQQHKGWITTECPASSPAASRAR